MDHEPDENLTHEQEWDRRYSESDRIWSGKPNDVLLREIAAAPTTTATALDLGCGEGADAIWLAEQGWRVTAVDISGVALRRAAEHAAASGLADRITWQQHDLTETFPAGSFDLVASFFLHSWRDMPRDRVLRSAVAAVAPGGTLLVVGHSRGPEGHEHHPEIHLPGPDEVLSTLQLAPEEWEVVVAAEHERVRVDLEGNEQVGKDNAVRVRRRWAVVTPGV